MLVHLGTNSSLFPINKIRDQGGERNRVKAESLLLNGRPAFLSRQNPVSLKTLQRDWLPPSISTLLPRANPERMGLLENPLFFRLRNFTYSWSLYGQVLCSSTWCVFSYFIHLSLHPASTYELLLWFPWWQWWKWRQTPVPELSLPHGGEVW